MTLSEDEASKVPYKTEIRFSPAAVISPLHWRKICLQVYSRGRQQASEPNWLLARDISFLPCGLSIGLFTTWQPVQRQREREAEGGEKVGEGG